MFLNHASSNFCHIITILGNCMSEFMGLIFGKYEAKVFRNIKEFRYNAQ